MRTKKSSRRPVKRPKSSRRKTTRVTVDFPVEEHKLIKAKAALEGVTLQEYIRRRTVMKENIPDKILEPIVQEIIEEHSELLKRLAKK